MQFWPHTYPDSSNWFLVLSFTDLKLIVPGVSLQTSRFPVFPVVILALFFSVLQSKSRETKATDSSVLYCSLRGPTQFREAQGKSLSLPFFLSQDNFCFYLYCFWSIRSFISYSYTDSPYHKQNSKQVAKISHKGMDLPSQASDILLLSAGHLITHPFPQVWDPECSYLRFRRVSASSPHFAISSWWSWKHLTPQALHCLLPLHCCNLSDSPLDTRSTNCDNHWNIFMYMILPLYFTLIILHFTHPFWYILLSKPTPPLHHRPPAHNQKSSFQRQWDFKSVITKTSLPNPEWHHYSLTGKLNP